MSEILREHKVHEQKSQNAVVIGMDEADDGDSPGTEASPTTDFGTIGACLQAVGVDTAKLQQVARLGSKLKVRNGKRPLLASFADSQSKHEFLRGFSALQPAVRCNAVYARDDLTPAQRDERARSDGQASFRHSTPFPVQAQRHSVNC